MSDLVADNGKEADALPSHIFIPIFAVLGVAIICAIIALMILLRRDSRRNMSRRARRTMRGASKLFSPQSSKGSMNATTTGGGGMMTKSTIEELSFHLPTNRQRPAPLSRNPSLIAAAATNAKSAKTNVNLLKTKKPDRSRPNTGNSAFSETFQRPWNWRKPSSNHAKHTKAPIMTITPASLPTSITSIMKKPPHSTVIDIDNNEDSDTAPTFWVEEQRDVGESDKQDIEWHAPTDWDIAGPITGGNVVTPAVPMPAFLKPSIPVDPRSIDPSRFPLPAISESLAGGPPGRWSSSQSSYMPGQRSSSVAGDSMFCTCDLDDIIEEEQDITPSGMNGAQPWKQRVVSISGSSINIRTGSCKACMRKSAMANILAAANGQATSPTTPLTPGFEARNSSVRKPRRKRKQEVSPRSKIAVAGRLYQEG